MTEYGEQVCRTFVKDLSVYFNIVSGMALGIDTIAHQVALECSANTVAVLGSGLDVIYPRKNKFLYDEIKENGVVVSEFPPRTE